VKEVESYVFAVHQVGKYREGRVAESYKYLAYSSQFLSASPEELDVLLEKIIGSLLDKKALIKKLRATPVSVIKCDLEPKTYKRIEDGNIANIYDLRRSIHRKYNGNIFSKISGIGKKNGAEIINALEKHGLWINLFTEKWEQSEDKAV
jgi:hypothetical protein